MRRSLLLLTALTLAVISLLMLLRALLGMLSTPSIVAYMTLETGLPVRHRA